VQFEGLADAPSCKDVLLSLRESPISSPSDSAPANPPLTPAEEVLRLFIEGAPTGIAMLDREMRYLAASRRWREQLDLDHDVVGQSHYDLFPDIPDRWREAHRRSLAGEVLRAEEDPYERADGTTRWFTWEIRPWRLADGTVGGITMAAEDVTDRRVSMQAAKQSERRFRELADSMPQLVWIASPDGAVHYYNSRAAEYANLQPDADGIWNWQPVVHPEDQAMTLNVWQAAVRSGSTYQMEHRLRMADGSFRWHLSRAVRIAGEGGGDEWFGTATDIHDVRAAQDALRESEELVRTIAENSTQGLAMMDARGTCTFANRAWLEMTGYTAEEIRSGPLHYLVHHHYPDGQPYPMEECPIDRALPENFDVRAHHDLFFRKDGSAFPVVCAASPIFKDGRPVSTVIEIRDLSEARRVEAERAESEERFQALAENIPQLAWMTDASGFIFWYNQRWFDYTGTTLEQMQGWGWKDVHHPDHIDRVVERWSDHLSRGEVWEDTFPLRGKDGQYRWFLSRAVPIRGADGKVTRWFGTNTDVTDQMGTAQRLQRAMTETHHRVKNNLQLITAMIDMHAMNAADGSVPVEELRDLGGQIAALARVHDLLTHQAKADGEVECVQAAALLETLLPLLQRVASGRPFAFRVGRDASLTLRQGTSLALIVNELVANAVKHSDGGVEVAFDVEDGAARLEVSDHGPGFPPDFDAASAAHTGLELIHHLSGWDLEGSAEYGTRETGGGRVRVVFPVVPAG
jgi:PAS domain S-box-containing protein